MIELLNMDCMAYMATLPDKAFELACVDPPYGIGVKSWDFTKPDRPRLSSKIRNGYTKYIHKDWDDCQPYKQYWEELLRISENQVVFGGNYFTDYLPVSRGWFYWNKGADYEASNNFSHGELAWTSFNKRLMSFTISPKSETKGGLTRIHPCQKPVRLYEWLLVNYAKQGDRILDTHLGSGSSAIASHNLGFGMVGIELDKDYYEAACKRLKEHQMQEKLFDPSIFPMGIRRY